MLTLVDCMFFTCLVGLARDVVGRVSWMFCLSCIVVVVAMLAWKVLELTVVCIFFCTFITFSGPCEGESMWTQSVVECWLCFCIFVIFCLLWWWLVSVV